MKTPLIALTALVAAGLTLTACSSSTDDADAGDPATGDPIRVGIIASASGASGIQGQKYAAGAQIAIEEINAAGGIAAIGNRPIEAVVVDDQSQPNIARELATELADDEEISAIVGPYGSALCLSVAPITEAEGLPTVCSGTSEQITDQGYQSVFNTSSLAGTFVDGIFSFLDYANDQKGSDDKKIAVLYENGAYGTNTFSQIEARAEKAGYEIAAALSFTAGDAELGPLLNRAEGSGAKYVVLGGFAPDVINALRAAEVSGIDDLTFVGLAGGVVNSSVAELGSTGEGLIGITEWNSDLAGAPGLQAFHDAYVDEFDEEPSTDSALGYLGMVSVAYALESAGTTDPAAVRDALHTISFKAPIFPQLDLSYDETGLRDPQQELVIATQLQSGKFVTVWPEESAAGDYKH